MTALLLALIALVQPDAPALPQVLARAQAYVLDCQKQLSGLVAEENYVQDSRLFRTTLSTTTMRSLSGRRDLKSDLLLVKPEGSDRWVQFRDVFEVDGKAVRDRSERLLDLFVKPTTSTRTQLDRITAESSRYNIGPIERNINVPILALTILLPENVAQFQFARGSKAAPELARYRPTADVWVLTFTETRKGTMIRGSGGVDLPASGRLWIEPDSGRVLATELTADLSSATATIDVVYGAGPFPNVLVPVEMREQY